MKAFVGEQSQIVVAKRQKCGKNVKTNAKFIKEKIN